MTTEYRSEGLIMRDVPPPSSMPQEVMHSLQRLGLDYDMSAWRVGNGWSFEFDWRSPEKKAEDNVMMPLRTPSPLSADPAAKPEPPVPDAVQMPDGVRITADDSVPDGVMVHESHGPVREWSRGGLAPQLNIKPIGDQEEFYEQTQAFANGESVVVLPDGGSIGYLANDHLLVFPDCPFTIPHYHQRSVTGAGLVFRHLMIFTDAGS